MNLLILNVLSIGALAGAFIASLFVDKRSPVLRDRLIVAYLGAVIGLLCAGAIVVVCFMAGMASAALEGSQ